MNQKRNPVFLWLKHGITWSFREILVCRENLKNLSVTTIIVPQLLQYVLF